MGELIIRRARARHATRHRPSQIAARRVGVAIAAAIVAAAALLPAAATAATGSLSTGDYTGPAGTQHYQLYVPSSYQPGVAMPMVVALHGCTQTADGFRRLTRWDQQAEAKGFLVLFPEQDPNSNKFRCWNWFLPGHMHRGSGEAAKIADLTRSIESRYAVDPHRVYAAGLSAGGAMASVLGATYPDVFAAIGVGSGCEYAATATCAGWQSADPNQAAQQAYAEMGPRARVLPFIAFQGDADHIVPPVNADQLVTQWLVTADLADDRQANSSVRRSPSGTSFGRGSAGGLFGSAGGATGTKSYTVKKYSDRGGAEIAQYWTVRGMAHAWSGGDPSQQYSDSAGPDETAAMYAFFAKQRMP
jgi:poly(hydroxyalkanoate) depolymerase family esterase